MTIESVKLSKSEKRRDRKKRAKERRAQESVQLINKDEDVENDVNHPTKLTNIDEFELRGGFTRFINHFDSDEEDKASEERDDAKVSKFTASEDSQNFNELPLKARAAAILQEDTEKDDQDEPKMGKKKMKQLQRMSTAGLKINVERPELVETWDYCSRDPLLLLELKALRNTVPVPRHWCAKRKYLQGKRGFEKPAFKLPEYIAKTGIMEMRQTIQDKDSDKNLKSKMREKIRPNVGRMDIDYKKFYDAFFKEQTKPPLSIHGDIYYEGKEFEVRLREKKPGQLSDDLRISLGLPTGLNSDKYPPPWLIAMQRYGPPPSYPNLKIAGLNAPIPYGCLFGYQANGWGKPPVDEMGRPIYGDVFMDNLPIPPPPMDDNNGHGFSSDMIVEEGGKLWGEIDSDDEDDGDEDDGRKDGNDEENDDDMDEDDDGDGMDIDHGGTGGAISVGGLITPATAGLLTPSGFSSLGLGLNMGGISSSVSTHTNMTGQGLRTPHSIELRKKNKLGDDEDEDDISNNSTLIIQPPPPPPPPPSSLLSSASFMAGIDKPPLYQVLSEVKTEAGAALIGNAKIYQIPATKSVTPANSVSQEAELPISGTTSATSNTQPGKVKKTKEFKF